MSLRKLFISLIQKIEGFFFKKDKFITSIPCPQKNCCGCLDGYRLNRYEYVFICNECGKEAGRAGRIEE